MIDKMEQPIPHQVRRYSEAEYLRIEEASASKREFRNGLLVDMAGGTFEHGRIAANLLRFIGNRLEGKPCQAVGSDMRIRIAPTGNYLYPDVSIVCGPPVFDPPDRRTSIANPQVVIEVTSPSTESADRTDKFSDYMRVESLREYILIAQDRPRIDTFYRQSDGVWAIGTAVVRMDEALGFPSLGISIPLTEIYADIAFAAT